MVNLLHMTDGFKVILGSFFVHLAALVTILAVVRPPDFGDDIQSTTRAKQMYLTLITMHMLTCAVRGVTIFVHEDAAFFNPFIILGTFVNFAMLC